VLRVPLIEATITLTTRRGLHLLPRMSCHEVTTERAFVGMSVQRWAGWLVALLETVDLGIPLDPDSPWSSTFSLRTGRLMAYDAPA
jgi:hypothetical protein